MDIEEKVKGFIEKERLVQKDDRILLGLSGGADSVCLFYLLLGLRGEIGFELRAVHVHHGIRGEADGDAAFAEELCRKEGVPCLVFREDVPGYGREKGLSEEEAGRILRYRDFREYLETWKAEDRKESAGGGSQHRYKIAAAHHENDQAETVLFQLFRGCGLSGLRGILPEREDIIRPLLCLSRVEIEGYLRERNISWCEDKTNASEEYSRNKIRNRVLPYVESEISGGAAAHIGKTAQIVREAEGYIRRQTEKAFQRTAEERSGGLVFDIVLLQQEDIFLQKQLILYGLEKVSAGRKDIGAVHVEDILRLMQKKGNGVLDLPGRVQVQKVYRKLLIFREDLKREDAFVPEYLLENGSMPEHLSESSSVPEHFPETGGVFPEEKIASMGNRGFLCGEKVPLYEEEKIDLTDVEAVRERFQIQNISEILGHIPEKRYTKWFDYDKIEKVFSIRYGENGDYLTINRDMNRKSFRRYMIEEKVPAFYRNHIWLFADGPHIVWVPGGRMSAYYKVTEQTKTILQIRICAEE